MNQRLAPKYYLDVVKITGSVDQPELNGPGSTIEYAVKMLQFPQAAQLDRVLFEDKLTFHHMDLLAQKIADFHKKIPYAGKEQNFGDLYHVYQPVLNCYADILKRLDDPEMVQRINHLKKWSEKEFIRLKGDFVERKHNGFIKECHGDLHLRNIAIEGEEVIAFDGIEFNADLRWIDVISEVAFLIMDLQDHGKQALASRFLNRYLELTGDYLGLSILNYYLVYRAIVRAMVSCIRLKQAGLSQEEIDAEFQEFQKYVALAESYIQAKQSVLLITFGFSGSGKTTMSQEILQQLSAIRIRSDIERKRLAGMQETQREYNGIKQGIYSASASENTYQHLLQLSNCLLKEGFKVIVDAAFFKETTTRYVF